MTAWASEWTDDDLFTLKADYIYHRLAVVLLLADDEPTVYANHAGYAHEANRRAPRRVGDRAEEGRPGQRRGSSVNMMRTRRRPEPHTQT